MKSFLLLAAILFAPPTYSSPIFDIEGDLNSKKADKAYLIRFRVIEKKAWGPVREEIVRASSQVEAKNVFLRVKKGAQIISCNEYK